MTSPAMTAARIVRAADETASKRAGVILEL
jgi:hypothetical protein